LVSNVREGITEDYYFYLKWWYYLSGSLALSLPIYGIGANKKTGLEKPISQKNQQESPIDCEKPR
jgi:hypothetical protein